MCVAGEGYTGPPKITPLVVSRVALLGKQWWSKSALKSVESFEASVRPNPHALMLRVSVGKLNL